MQMTRFRKIQTPEKIKDNRKGKKMKKKIIAAILICCLGLTMAGCGEKEKSGDSGKKTEALGSMDNYVKLGQYRGITLSRDSNPVTEEEVQQEISYYLTKYPEEIADTEAKIQTGDAVSVTFEGKVDGELFEGGSGTEESLVIGSKSFIDGFEDGMIGMKKGESKDLNLKFPSDYNEKLGGKDVVFHVTVNAIKRPLAAMTDEWVAKNTDLKTVAEFEGKIKESLKQNYENELERGAWTQVVESSEILEYPEAELEAGRQLFDMNMQALAAKMGVTLEQLKQLQGTDDEKYAEQRALYGEKAAAAKMVLNAIVEKEGFKVEDEEYQTLFKNYVQQSGKTEEAFIEAYGEDTIERDIMLRRVVKLIMDNAYMVEATPTPAEVEE